MMSPKKPKQPTLLEQIELQKKQHNTLGFSVFLREFQQGFTEFSYIKIIYSHLKTNKYMLLFKVSLKLPINKLTKSWKRSSTMPSTKTKQIVLEYQKSEESKQNGTQAYENDNEVQSETNLDDNLQDLELQYKDGYIYLGQGIEPTIRQGYGILCDQLENEVYQGFWQDDKYHGHGKLINTEAEQFDGPFDYAFLNLIENGWIGFEGEFNEGKMNGEGVLTLTNGEKFEGTFEDGLVDGLGAFQTLEGQMFMVLDKWNFGARKLMIT